MKKLQYVAVFFVPIFWGLREVYNLPLPGVEPIKTNT